MADSRAEGVLDISLNSCVDGIAKRALSARIGTSDFATRIAGTARSSRLFTKTFPEGSGFLLPELIAGLPSVSSLKFLFGELPIFFVENLSITEQNRYFKRAAFSGPGHCVEAGLLSTGLPLSR